MIFFFFDKLTEPSKPNFQAALGQFDFNFKKNEVLQSDGGLCQPITRPFILKVMS